MKFSACWIVKNEEKNLKESILSVKDCAEEMIVVDTGSTDATVRVAEQCGAKVAHFKWTDDFSAARNYALSLARGEFVIFIDADEHFYPPLTAKDRKKLAAKFRKTKADVIGINSIEVEKEDNTVVEVHIRERIFRRAAVRYENRIHEVPRGFDGKIPKWAFFNEYAVIHTGYSREIAEQKIRRNLKLLEEEQQRLTDPFKLYMNASYLMRELFFIGDYDKAAKTLLYLLANHRHYPGAYEESPVGFLRHFYNANHIVEMRRGKFSRKEIYDKLFGSFSELCHDTRDAIVGELHYQLRYDYREERFLRELEAAEPKLLTAFPMDIPDRRLVEMRIYEQAAEACHMRGDRRNTCLYAYRAMECMQLVEGRVLLLLLYALKDHPLEDARRILRSAAVPGRADVAGKVIQIIEMKGAREQLFAGAAPAEVFPPENRRLSVVGAQDSEPDRLVFFRMNAEKAYAVFRYADIADNPDADFAAAKEYRCAYYTAYACLMMGEYEKAYSIVSPHIKGGKTVQELLGILLVTAEKMPQPMAGEARKLYEESMAILDEMVDLSDIISTGTVYGADPDKEKSALAAMTPSAFFEGYERDKNRPVSEMLLQTHEKAAPVLEENGCVLAAAESYRLMLAKDRDTAQNRRNLTRLLGDCGNHELARQTEKLQ
ncbi:MAG: glycosyltransferase family 2 protein [Oscillospiraceae bacterium]|jgi:glycosyltransferase involved in cell wall biosynthesis|nr:glycosyltransferase family 2 protein [Oscillospiraceae bacterium]